MIIFFIFVADVLNTCYYDDEDAGVSNYCFVWGFFVCLISLFGIIWVVEQIRGKVEQTRVLLP